MSDVYTLSILVSIAVFTLSTHITPGPTNIILLSSVLNFGYKKSLPFMLANIISYPMLMGFITLDIGMFLIQYPIAMSSLKFIGVIYLCYMAYKIATISQTYESKEDIKPFTLWQGIVYPWLNPKAWIVYTSTISIYITSSDKSSLQLAIIVLFIFVSMIITTYAWTFGGVILKNTINDSKFIKKVNITLAILLLSSMIPIVV